MNSGEGSGSWNNPSGPAPSGGGTKIDGNRMSSVHDPHRRITQNLMEPLSVSTGQLGVWVSLGRADGTRLTTLADVVVDFSISSEQEPGLRQLRTRAGGYQPRDLVPGRHLVQQRAGGDAFSTIVHEQLAYEYGRRTAEKLRSSRQFEVPIQTAIRWTYRSSAKM
jgi:hypothetical protein